MLNQVQHDEVVVASPWTPSPPIRHPEHHPYVTLNLFQGPFFEMLNQVQHDEVGVVRASFFRRRSSLSFFYSSMIPINLSHPNHETASSLRSSQRQVRGCHCEPRFFVWWSSLVFSPKGCHCEVVFSFPKQSLFFSLVPESYFENTPWERRKPK